jgi:hypothetical protein
VLRFTILGIVEQPYTRSGDCGHWHWQAKVIMTFHNRQLRPRPSPIMPKMVAPNRPFNSRDPKKGHRVLRHDLSSRFLSNYGTGVNALKDPQVVFQTIAPAIDPPPCIITSIDQPFHHTDTMSPTRRLLRSRSASGLGVASGWPGTPPRLRRPLSATGYNRFDDRTHPNTPKSFKKCRRHRRLHRRAACFIEPIDLYASDGATSQ